jgi:hypothetical protein
LIAGCKQGQSLMIHYMGHPARVFFPAKIGVVTPVMERDPYIGTIVDRAGYVRTRLYLPDAPGQVAELISRSLADAGLQPVQMAGVPADGDLPTGVDFMITSSVQELRCTQQFLPEQGSDNGFILSARAQMHFTLSGRGGELYSADEFGDAGTASREASTEKQLADMKEPADAVSGALLEAITRLIDDHQFQEGLPHRTS